MGPVGAVSLRPMLPFAVFIPPELCPITVVGIKMRKKSAENNKMPELRVFKVAPCFGNFP
jgi:hypothetical protein